MYVLASAYYWYARKRYLTCHHLFLGYKTHCFWPFRPLLFSSLFFKFLSKPTHANMACRTFLQSVISCQIILVLNQKMCRILVGFNLVTLNW